MSVQIVLKNLLKSYSSVSGDNVEILKNINLSVSRGESVALVGPSGCGKTTLLNILGLIDKQDGGEYLFGGEDVCGFNEQKKHVILQQNISFVYQFHHLFKEFSVIENIMLPLLMNGVDFEEARRRARIVLEQVQLQKHENDKIFSLSGGEQQRVAIARAIVKNPMVILADEPTGNLDPKTADVVFDVLVQSAKMSNASFICVTHNYDIARKLDCCFGIEDGKLQKK